MSFESDIVAKYGGLFNDRLWFDSAPEGTPRSDMSAPFCIVQQVGGDDSWFIDNSLKDMQHARMQFFVWGERRDEVSMAMRQLREAVALSITPTWITSPLGAPVADWNEVLDLRGLRCDFGFAYADEFYRAPDYAPQVGPQAEDAGNVNPATMMGGSGYGNSRFELTEDFAGLYQDINGVNPVTALGQRVCWMLDRQFDFARGPELVNNGGFDSNITGWTSFAGVSVVWENGKFKQTSILNGASSQYSQQIIAAGVNKFYEASVDIVSNRGARMRVSGSDPSYSNNGLVGSYTRRGLFKATGVGPIVYIDNVVGSGWGATGDINTFDNVSVREVLGNHAYQTVLSYAPTIVRDSAGRLRLKFGPGSSLNVQSKPG